MAPGIIWNENGLQRYCCLPYVYCYYQSWRFPELWLSIDQIIRMSLMLLLYVLHPIFQEICWKHNEVFKIWLLPISQILRARVFHEVHPCMGITLMYDYGVFTGTYTHVCHAYHPLGISPVDECFGYSGPLRYIFLQSWKTQWEIGLNDPCVQQLVQSELHWAAQSE